MSMSDASHWFGGHNSWLTFVGISAVLLIILIPVIMFTLYKYCGVKFQFQEINSILAKPLLLNKTSETIQLALANAMNDYSIITFQMLELKLIQIVVMIMSLIFICYLLFKLTLWLYDYMNTNYLNISSTGLKYLRTMTLDKTSTYNYMTSLQTNQ